MAARCKASTDSANIPDIRDSRVAADDDKISAASDPAGPPRRGHHPTGHSVAFKRFPGGCGKQDRILRRGGRNTQGWGMIMALRKLVAGNWKMNGSLASLTELDAIAAAAKAQPAIDVAI